MISHFIPSIVRGPSNCSLYQLEECQVSTFSKLLPRSDPSVSQTGFLNISWDSAPPNSFVLTSGFLVRIKKPGKPRFSSGFFISAELDHIKSKSDTSLLY